MASKIWAFTGSKPKATISPTFRWVSLSDDATTIGSSLFSNDSISDRLPDVRVELTDETSSVWYPGSFSSSKKFASVTGSVANSVLISTTASLESCSESWLLSFSIAESKLPIEVVADDSLPKESKLDLELFLKNWLSQHINDELKDLLNLKKTKIENQYLRALVFQIYENNGIIKRKQIEHIVKLISKEERKKLWGMGIKIGKYHIYLPRMLKPKAVSLRVNLWRLFHEMKTNTQIPKSGLNFIESRDVDKKFLLLCGFENFKNFFVRVDILEKLFINILSKTVARKFKITTEMMNLLGCSKENFYKLMELMNYKRDKEKDAYIFLGEGKKIKKIFKNRKTTSPFDKLL